ncbi:MAG: hypothetical protein ABIO70_29370 [Pseudomonadota bacterium]
MAAPVASVILTLGAGADGRDVVLVEEGRPPLLARLSEAPVRGLERVSAMLRPPGGLLVPGDDADAVARERVAALALAGLFAGEGTRAITQRLTWIGGAAEGRGAQLHVLLDVRDPALRALPWETVEGLPRERCALAGCRILRLGEGRAERRTERSTHLEVLVYAPEREDPTCARVLRDLRANLAPLPRVAMHDLAVGEEPAPPLPGVLRAVHIVAHGHEALGRVTLAIGEGRRLSAESALHGLMTALAGAGLAVLDICGGGAGGPAPEDVPAWRLLEAGVAACVAPSVPLAVEASTAFSTALYAGLIRGDSLAGAVAAGRRALRGLGLDHPSCRWYNPVLVVADGQGAACQPVLDTPCLPVDAPVGDPSAEGLLRRASRLAEAQGFLGLEQVALSLAGWDRTSPLLSLAAGSLPAVSRELPVFLPGMGERALAITPRLTQLLTGLPPGYGTDDLLRALVGVPWVARRLDPRVVSRVLLHTVDDRSTRPLGARLPGALLEASGRGLQFEVLGGPDDGRLLALEQAGEVLGRWDPQRDGPARTRLFLDDGPRDPHFSRSHLRSEGGGRVTVLAPTWRLIEGAPAQALQGTVSLHGGEELLLGGGTHLEVRRAG